MISHPLPGHGTLIQFDAQGIYLIGDSGVGKSEIALELIEQGAVLICDDAPQLSVTTDKQAVLGTCPENFYGLMHLRDLGVINLIDLFSEQSFQKSHRIDMVIELVKPDHNSLQAVQTPSRQHFVELSENYLDWQYENWTIPGIRLHLYPGRNISVLIKTVIKHLRKMTSENTL